jgi:hypothetical protein
VCGKTTLLGDTHCEASRILRIELRCTHRGCGTIYHGTDIVYADDLQAHAMTPHQGSGAGQAIEVGLAMVWFAKSAENHLRMRTFSPRF